MLCQGSATEADDLENPLLLMPSDPSNRNILSWSECIKIVGYRSLEFMVLVLFCLIVLLIFVPIVLLLCNQLGYLVPPESVYRLGIGIGSGAKPETPELISASVSWFTASTPKDIKYIVDLDLNKNVANISYDAIVWTYADDVAVFAEHLSKREAKVDNQHQVSLHPFFAWKRVALVPLVRFPAYEHAYDENFKIERDSVFDLLIEANVTYNYQGLPKPRHEFVMIDCNDLKNTERCEDDGIGKACKIESFGRKEDALRYTKDRSRRFI